MLSNLHYIFYKEYYQFLLCDKKEEGIERINESNNNKITSYTYNGNKMHEKGIPCNVTIDLCTKYPGLLAGMGMPHYVGNSKKGIDLGFSFDYVTGLPYIPGSTVKGCLRQVFSGKKIIYVKEFFGITDDKAIEELEEKIFGHAKEDSESLVGGSDTFFDAQIVAGSEKAEEKILGMDNITPHKSPVEEPTIINILKILPGVTFRFQFKLTDTTLSDGTIVAIQQKKDLFESVLMDFGIGAKTNVGYGSLSKNGVPNIKVQQEPTIFNKVYTGHIMEVARKQIKVKLDGQNRYPKLKSEQITKDGKSLDLKIKDVFHINDCVAVIFLDGDDKTAYLEYCNQSEDIQKKMCSTKTDTGIQ